MNRLKHLAIIMDGNGRWAKIRGQSRLFGHLRGAQVAKTIIEECARRKIDCLTLFTFSTENWRRPPEEIKFLMLLLRRRLRQEKTSLIKNNISFHVIGDISQLPKAVQKVVQQTIQDTAHCTGMRLVFALNYGGRQDLTHAIRKIGHEIQKGSLLPDEINEETICTFLGSADLPDPDLIVRTSGESRLSNFYLWQAAYSELYLTETLWPDFTIDELTVAIGDFNNKERRFGKISEQLQLESHVVN